MLAADAPLMGHPPAVPYTLTHSHTHTHARARAHAHEYQVVGPLHFTWRAKEDGAPWFRRSSTRGRILHAAPKLK